MQDMQHSAGSAGDRHHLLTTKDVQDLIRVDRSTIYRMAESGRLPAVKVGRQWRFPEGRLLQWLNRHQPSGAPASLDELIAADALTALNALLGEMLGVMFVITDMDGRPLAEVGHPCGLFTAAHAYPKVLERCVSGWRDMAGEPDLDPRWQPTPLGFLCARTLVRVGDHLAGMVLAGGVAPPGWPPDASALAELAAELGVPAALLLAHTDGVYRLSPGEQERVLRLLPRVGAFLSRLAGNNGSSDSRPPGGAPRSSAQTQRSVK
jgi:excisionase family DNA binding protein